MSKNLGRKHAIVIGGGITGLATCYRLQREATARDIPLDITLLEASGRVGGVVETEHRDGFLIEHGPDAFISTKPAAKGVVRRTRYCGSIHWDESKNPSKFCNPERNVISCP